MIPSSGAVRARHGIEAVVALAVAAVAFALAFVYVQRVRELGFVPSFYQADYEPAVRLACGQPFGIDAAGRQSPELAAFLRVERDRLDCSTVGLAAAPNPFPPTRAWYHLLQTVAAVWMVTGVSWEAVDGVAAAMMGLSAVFIYGILRLCLPAPLALLLTAASVRPALPYLMYLRDLSKAPFILGALFVAGLVVLRPLRRGALWAIMAAAGAWLGIGYGFRPDVLIALPLVAAAALFFRPGPLSATWRDGVAAVLLLCATFLAAASPVLVAFGGEMGSCHWHFAVLGLSDEHAAALGVGPGPVSWLSQYEDGMARRAITSYSARADFGALTGFCTPAYDVAGRTMFLDILSTFPADFLARTAAAARHVLGYGIWGMPNLPSFGPIGSLVDANRSLVQYGCVIAWLMTAALLFAREARLGVVAFLAVAYLTAYPVIQFDPRHFFHLAFLAWLPLGFAVATLVRWPKTGASGAARWWAALQGGGAPDAARWRPARAGMFIGIVGVAALAAHEGSRAAQALSASALFDRYRAAPGQEAISRDRPAEGGLVRVELDEPVSGSARSGGGRMLRLDFGGASCPTGRLEAVLGISSADGREGGRQIVPVRIGPESPRTVVFSPTYFQPGKLDRAWVAMAIGDRPCLTRALWLDPASLPPLWVGATIPG